MQPQRGLIKQSLGTADVFYDDGLGQAIELLLFLWRQIFARVNDHRQLLMLGPYLLDQFEAGNVGQHQIEDHATEFLVAQLGQRVRRTWRFNNFDSSISDKLANGGALNGIVLDHEQL